MAYPREKPELVLPQLQKIPIKQLIHRKGTKG